MYGRHAGLHDVNGGATSPPLIEDPPSDDEMDLFSDSDDDVILKPLDNPCLEESMNRSASFASLSTPHITSSASAPIPPCIVTPIQDKRSKIADVARSCGAGLDALDLGPSYYQPPFAPRCAPPPEDLGVTSLTLSFWQTEQLHSGDEVFFEGRPFHYLETRDIVECTLYGAGHI